MNDTTFNSEHWTMLLSWKVEYESRTSEKLTRKQFISSDDLVANCAAWIQNQYSITYSNQEIRDLLQSAERGSAWCLTPEELPQHLEQRKKFKKEYGVEKGPSAIFSRNETAASKHRAKLQQSSFYREYINGSVWKNRRNRYIREHASNEDGQAICELCGNSYNNWAFVNVHHNNYEQLNGEELDTSLCCVCSENCHAFADSARLVSKGHVDWRRVHDLLMPMFSLFEAQK